MPLVLVAQLQDSLSWQVVRTRVPLAGQYRCLPSCQEACLADCLADAASQCLCMVTLLSHSVALLSIQGVRKFPCRLYPGPYVGSCTSLCNITLHENPYPCTHLFDSSFPHMSAPYSPTHPFSIKTFLCRQQMNLRKTTLHSLLSKPDL